MKILLLVFLISFIIFVNNDVFAEREKPDVVISISNGTKSNECNSDCYNPNNLTVEVGTKLIMKNNDIAAHSFTSDKFNSQLLINGMEYNWIVEPGTVTYHCALHPLETGTITGIIAPTVDNITVYPTWFPILFIWYDNGTIDYTTLINALEYMVNKGYVW